MQEKRIALVTGANQGVGLQVAKEFVANGLTVLVGSRNFERGEAAAFVYPCHRPQSSWLTELRTCLRKEPFADCSRNGQPRASELMPCKK
jgi:NAD(P)-dependent dehydrogenase (short-subunit alcohol dehydrogenase family)